jgi:hypothetical protein
MTDTGFASPAQLTSHHSGACFIADAAVSIAGTDVPAPGESQKRDARGPVARSA